MSTKIDPEFMKSDKSIPEDFDPDPDISCDEPNESWIHFNDGPIYLTKEEVEKMTRDIKIEYSKCDVCGEEIEGFNWINCPFIILCPSCKQTIVRQLRLNKL